jgi:hypothetical protein
VVLLAGKLSDLDYLGCCVVQIIGLALPQQLAPQVGGLGWDFRYLNRHHFRNSSRSLERNKNEYRVILSIYPYFISCFANSLRGMGYTELFGSQYQINKIRSRFNLILSAPPLQKHYLRSSFYKYVVGVNTMTP